MALERFGGVVSEADSENVSAGDATVSWFLPRQP